MVRDSRVENESDSSVTTPIRNLVQTQFDRRSMMLGALAAGGFAALAALPKNAFAQSTPAASPAASPITIEQAPPYEGALADVQEIRIPTSEPATMDPAVSTGFDELNIFFNIFDGLVGIDTRTGEVVPRLAESYETNADTTEFTFKIRQGLTWSDGTPLNANDFVYSWQRVLDPNTISAYTPALYPIKNAEKIEAGEAELTDLGVAASDDNTLVVTLEGATPYFPLLMTTWTFFPVPKHVVDEKGDQWVEAENIVSNGPFIMTEWTHDQQIVLEPNPTYYGDKPTLTKATFRIFEDTTTQAYIAFDANELDYVAPEGTDLEQLLADPSKATIIEFAASNCYFVVADTTTAPTDSVEFRQALYKSIDRDLIANTILKGQFLPAFTILSPDIPGNNPNAGMTESVDEAKQLIAASGIDAASTEIELYYLSSPARYKTVAEYLQATWQEVLGIKVKLSSWESSSAYTDWRASRANEPFNVYTGTWGSDFADPSNWMNQNFTSQADHYENHWKNDEFDSLVATAVVNTNVEERNAQYQQAEAILVEQASIIPLYRGINFRAVKLNVKDLWFQPILSVPHLRTVKIAAE